MQVYYPSDKLQTTFSSVPDTNNIPATSTSVSTGPTTTDSSSTSSDIATQTKDFFQDNSTYIFIGLGVAILLFTFVK